MLTKLDRFGIKQCSYFINLLFNLLKSIFSKVCPVQLV